MQGVTALFEPLEEVIRNSLIPAICKKAVSDIEREIIALPYSYGGHGIRNSVKTYKDQFDQPVMITSGLNDIQLRYGSF